MDVLSGTATTLWIDFLSPLDELQVPDGNSISYMLFSGTGVQMAGPIAINPPIGSPDATGVQIKIAAGDNTIGAGRLFDHRTILVSWMSGGASGSRRVSYRLIPFPLYSVTEDTIRDVIGLASDELPDQSIDIFSGYLIAAALFQSRSVLDTALTSGTVSEVIANRILAYTVVLEMLPALSQRILQSKTDGSLKTDRLKTIDLAAIAAGLLARRALDVDEISGVDVSTLTSGTVILLTTPTIDPVTGNTPE